MFAPLAREGIPVSFRKGKETMRRLMISLVGLGLLAAVGCGHNGTFLTVGKCDCDFTPPCACGGVAGHGGHEGGHDGGEADHQAPPPGAMPHGVISGRPEPGATVVPATPPITTER
jgi:hypothetical protein